MRARWTVIGTLAAGACLLALSASAQDVDELHPADRWLVHGYSPEAMQLLWATVADGEDPGEACGVEEGAAYTYSVDDEGNVTVSDEAGDVVTDEGACDLTATDVTGPEGQVNHGTVVSSFVRDLKEALRESGYTGGLGCYVRVIAQSDYGKGDQQIRVSDVDETTEPSAEEPTVDLTITETTCGGEGDDDADTAEAKGSGKPDWAGKGKPPWAGKGKPEGKGGPPPHAKGKR